MENEEEFGRRLLNPLAEEPPGPSRVDLSEAMAAGRRRRRARSVVTTVGLLAVTGLVVTSIPVVINRAAAGQLEPGGTASVSAAPTASPSPHYDRTTRSVLPEKCTGEPLAVSAVGQVYAGAIDPTGHYATYRTYHGGRHPMIWHDGDATEVATSGQDDMFTDVNSQGVAVGTSYEGGKAVDSGTSVALAYQYGADKPQRLKGGSGEARAINERGVIVGMIGNAPVRWSSPISDPTLLPIPKGSKSGAASDVDADGTVVGSVRSGDSVKSPGIAYLWTPEGEGRALPAPRWDGHVISGYDARRISNGWVFGYGNVRNGKLSGSVAIRWDLATGEVRVLPDLRWGNDINPSGWMAGMGRGNHAVLTDGEKTVRLPDVLPFPKQYGMNFAQSMSDDGRTIVGNVDDAKDRGVQKGVIWRCE
jgi:hypothetical protein